MTEQTTKSKNTIYTDDITPSKWSELTTQVRDTRKTARITDVTVNGETAELQYRVQGISDVTFTEEVDAKISPESKSPFENLLEEHGYTPHEPTKLINESIEVGISRADDGIKFDLLTDETGNKQKDEKTGELMTLLISLLVGTVPILNIVIIAELLYESTIRDAFTDKDLVASIGVTASTTILYITLPILQIMS